MELTMCILTNKINLNKLQFTNDFINGVVENKSKYIGIPLVVNRLKLENGLYNNLTHELDTRSKQLKTDTIGSFVDFWSQEDEDGTLLLMGLARVLKRYPNVCNAILELYETEELEFSCEVLVYGYDNYDEETGIRSLNYEYEGQINELIGSCIVTNPAEPKSKAHLLIAEAVDKDLKGGEIVSDKSEKKFNNGFNIRYHGDLELSSLKWSDISNQVYNILNPVNPKNNYREYNYYIVDLYTDFVIVEDWDDHETLYKINYKIENDVVVLEPKENWIEGYKGFIPKGFSVDDLLAAKNKMQLEMNNQIQDLNNKHKEEVETMEEKIKELESQVESLQKQVNDLNELVVSQKEEIVQLKNKETELNSTIEELKPYKEKVELAEKQAKQTALSEKYSKLLSKEAMESEEVKKAIEELNEARLNEIVVNEVAKEVAKKQQDGTQDKDSDEVIITASRQSSLLPEDLKTRLYEVQE
jgi:hypothetical protein